MVGSPTPTRQTDPKTRQPPKPGAEGRMCFGLSRPRNRASHHRALVSPLPGGVPSPLDGEGQGEAVVLLPRRERIKVKV